MKNFYTDYTTRLTAERDGESSVYHLNISDRTGIRVFSRAFICVPGGEKVRVLEEFDGMRFFHGQFSLNKTQDFVESLARRYAAAYFLEILGKRQNG